jgi:hypothetical protein
MSGSGKLDCPRWVVCRPWSVVLGCGCFPAVRGRCLRYGPVCDFYPWCHRAVCPRSGAAQCVLDGCEFSPCRCACLRLDKVEAKLTFGANEDASLAFRQARLSLGIHANRARDNWLADVGGIRNLRLSARENPAIRKSCYRIDAATQNKCGKFSKALIFLSCQRTANPRTPVRFRPPPPA